MTEPQHSPSSNIWKEKPEFVERYYEELERYEQLGSEVAYILKKRMKEKGIEFSAVTFRAKTLRSFAEKVSRKSYSEPFSQITDRVGVRLVSLYKDDQDEIEKIIREEFNVLEKVDKNLEQGDDRFGYGAVHFIVTLSPRSAGVRYEDLKELKCEIQTRTVLQDAWAIIDHHLFYKKGQDAPPFLRRKLNSLAGLIETADDQFSNLKEQREKFLKELGKTSNNPSDLLNQPTNVDTIHAYLKKAFPRRKLQANNNHISYILEPIVMSEYPTIRDIDDLLKRTSGALKAYASGVNIRTSAGALAISLALDLPEYRETGWEYETIERMKEFEHLVTPRGEGDPGRA